MNYIDHQFRPDHTITAAIRFYNGEAIDKPTMDSLLAQFKTLNPEVVVTAGGRAKVPLLPGITVDGMHSA